MRQGMELLAPAGSMEILKAVIDAGADAVYLGGDQFGARAYANNFSKEELVEALDYAHLRGKKIYLTVNTLLKNQEINKLREYLLPFYENGLDAVLVQDFGALAKIHEWFPDMEIHTSTQMTVTGTEGVRFLQQYGVTRVVMAREVSIAEMKKIHEETGIEIEAFVHGALCYCYSGQCLFSSLLGGRSGNRGRCAQPCRLPYTVMDEHKKKLKEESYILSLKDFCSLHALREMYEAGVYSLKIEGRMKQQSYAAGVTSIYRKYVDAALSDSTFNVPKEDDIKLNSYGNRCGFTDGYLYKHNDKNMITYEKPSFTQAREYIGEQTCYQKISGDLTIKKNEPIKFTIKKGFCEVTVQGPIPDIALKQPITKDDVDKRMRKTRDTAFLFGELNIELEDGLFVPNGVLNQVKRDAICMLEQQILSEYRRTASDDSVRANEVSFRECKTDYILDRAQIVSLENRLLLPVALKFEWITDIYLDSTAYDRKHLIELLTEDVEKCHACRKKAFFIMPAICREKTLTFYKSIVEELLGTSIDGVVVKNLESLYFAKKHMSDLCIVCDHNLYTYNDDAVDAYRQSGADYVTMPLEMNRNEIANRMNETSEMWVYGYYPLMTSAQCVCNNSTGCSKTPGVRYIRDRYQKDFPVRNCCSECYNIIYNSLPTMLFLFIDELKKQHIRRFRLHFSVETAEKANEILNLYGDFITQKKDTIPSEWRENYTNGHYKRGVE